MKNPKRKRKNGTSKAEKQTTVQKLGSALASTASFAVDVAQGAEERVRSFASSLTKPVEDSARAPDLLTHQHRQIEKLFEQLVSSKKNFDATLRKLADDLSAHIAIEEKLFYPAVRKLDRDVILEGLEEHAMGRFALKRLLGTSSSDESLQSRLKALKELMTNHHKEEESDLFPKARKAMPNEELEKLGSAMKKLYEINVERGHEAVLASFADELRRPVRAKSAVPKKTVPARKKQNGQVAP